MNSEKKSKISIKRCGHNLKGCGFILHGSMVTLILFKIQCRPVKVVPRCALNGIGNHRNGNYRCVQLTYFDSFSNGNLSIISDTGGQLS